ncbi:hypothetical protein K7X08_018876 [Anisodus acutangulus]|uniref:Uncharacterized protein n=1 Tax=Anisodus acutangulus TaxID=402998 RepID=A0A9Q1LWI8_9SOLA|nr:hypothetical protein K7X08_018876 [Anisodus acutangulus]
MATYGCGSDIYGSGRGGAGASGSTLKLTTTDALSYLKEVKNMFPDQVKYHMFIDVMKDFRNQSCIKSKRDVLEKRAGTGRAHDQDYKEPDNENEGDLSMQCLTDKMKSVLKVEEFGGPHEDKNALMKCCFMYAFVFGIVLLSLVSNLLNMICSILPDTYSQGFTFCEKVADVLGKYPDLMEGFNEFIERYERVVGFLVGVMSQRKSDEGHTSKLVKEEEKEDRAQV